MDGVYVFTQLFECTGKQNCSKCATQMGDHFLRIADLGLSKMLRDASKVRSGEAAPPR